MATDCWTLLACFAEMPVPERAKPVKQTTTSTTRRLVCAHPGCGVQRDNEAALLQHIHSEHTSLRVTDLMPPPPAPGARATPADQWWTCDDCSLKHCFNSEASLNRHRQQVHPNLQFTKDQW